MDSKEQEQEQKEEYNFNQIYTVGCFDYFHYGHKEFFNNLRKHGKQIIAGIHDDSSLEKLKNLKPSDHESLTIRMHNVKTYADIVYVIPSTDPTLFIQMIDDKNENSKCYIRADDMRNFPGIEYVSSVMPIIYLPYTKGVSSTQIRKERQSIMKRFTRFIPK